MLKSGLLATLCSLILGGCVYQRTPVGTFQGKYSLVWSKSDYFIYLPDKSDPFRFTRSNGETITPQAMYTDGGSIPRELWILRSYSPWTYGPAYLIHDWLFLAHDCGPAEYQKYTVQSSSDVMAEAMKTLIVEKKAPKSAAAFDLIVWAVKTKVAQKLWDAPSDCQVPAAEAAGMRFAHGVLRAGPSTQPFGPQSTGSPMDVVQFDLNQKMPQE